MQPAPIKNIVEINCHNVILTFINFFKNFLNFTVQSGVNQKNNNIIKKRYSSPGA